VGDCTFETVLLVGAAQLEGQAGYLSEGVILGQEPDRAAAQTVSPNELRPVHHLDFQRAVQASPVVEGSATAGWPTPAANGEGFASGPLAPRSRRASSIAG
jgi:hypothetical protein